MQQGSMKLNISLIQLGALFAFISAFLFSSKAIFIKQAYSLTPSLDAITLMAIRMGIALPFFLLICWFCRHQNRNIKLIDFLYLLSVGLLGYYISSWLDFYGLMFITASLERIILFLYPTMTVLASSFILKQKLSSKTIFALVLSYGGTVIVMLQEQKTLPDQHNFWFGASLVFASAVAFACYLLLTPPLIKKFGSWNLTGLSLSAACIGTLIHFLMVTSHPVQLLSSLPVQVIWYGICLGLFVTVLPTLLLILSIEYVGATQSAIISSISPIVTIIFSVFLLNEHLNTIQWLGCFLNIFGVMLITLKRK
ncbi:EamA family transporter [Acinetobacter baumannii]|nr:EamA family transporter [Acinetobacter baumannii]NAS39510.1 EamA family transporter [Acinetobacter baumannii]TLT87103.1 DMT family transporter [Acinetobacter baumannii]SSO51868.1 DMT family permease [Acinetobacter baumannii]